MSERKMLKSQDKNTIYRFKHRLENVQ